MSAPSFFRACAVGDVDRIRELLSEDPALARAREPGDNATALHLAAANGHVDVVRMLLDAGADPRAGGDMHDGEVIGWASRPGNEKVIDLLLERGAKHHIYSAMALRDRDLVKRVIEESPENLERRRSKFENAQTPLHAAFAPPDGLGVLGGKPNYEILQLLIDLGADLEATDDKGRTAMDLAVLRGDGEAMRILEAAGARKRERSGDADFAKNIAAAATSVSKGVPMFFVPDVAAAVRWYESIGFTVRDRFEDDGQLVFAELAFGGASFTLTPGVPGPSNVRMWFITDAIDTLYALLKTRPDVPFEEDLYEPFYGGRQFSIRDVSGLDLIFWQPGHRLLGS